MKGLVTLKRIWRAINVFWGPSKILPQAPSAGATSWIELYRAKAFGRKSAGRREKTGTREKKRFDRVRTAEKRLPGARLRFRLPIPTVVEHNIVAIKRTVEFVGNTERLFSLLKSH